MKKYSGMEALFFFFFKDFYDDCSIKSRRLILKQTNKFLKKENSFYISFRALFRFNNGSYFKHPSPTSSPFHK